jgi:DNA-binding LacI/PurR family transcriptional regulator
MTAKKNAPDPDKPATLKMLAEYLDLSPATVSIVLNNSPVATSIPAATKQRVHAAAKKFDYRPNLHARMLRSRLTNTIGIIAPELSEGYFTGVMLGVEQYLLQEGFLYFTVSHLGQPDLKDEYQELLMRRRVDGFLLVNTQLSLNVPVPVVGISSHTRNPGVTNIMLDHNVAARMLRLYKMGSAAAELLIKRILSPDEPYPHDVCFEPELIVRESTMGVHQASPPRPSKAKR